MIKVITPIGAVVEVDESVYENNKDTLSLYSETKVEVSTANMTSDEVEHAVMKPKSKK